MTMNLANPVAQAAPTPIIVNSVFYGMRDAAGAIIPGDEIVGAFVRSRLRNGVLPDFELPRDGQKPLFAGLGIVKGGYLIGGVLFHNLHTFRGNPVWMEAAIACDSPRWATKQTLRQLFTYPFVQLKCATLMACIRKSNKRSRRLCEGLGFVNAGKLSHGYDGKEDLIVYEMTSEKCRWIKEKKVA